LDPVKGALHSLRSLGKAAPHIGPFKLTVLGDGPERQSCQDLTRELGLGELVEFRGMVSHAEALRAMDASDILLQHNVRTADDREECLSLSVLEAMAREVTPIITRSGGMPEAVRHGETGMIVESGDEANMSAAIVELANDPDRCRTMGRAARIDVNRRFNLDRQNQALGQFLRRIGRNDQT
jgi:glycosyltransferase involved in cell wall biosynthesis